MFDRLILVAAVAAAVGLASPAAADPQCQPGPCTHGTSPSNPATHSGSYQDGYKSEHDYYSTPRNHSFLASEMTQGYTAGLVCQTEIGGGPPPVNVTDWLAGCTDALHDLGFRP